MDRSSPSLDPSGVSADLVEPVIRRAVADDVPAVAQVLADAFGDYPWTRWTVDGDGHGDRLRALHMMFLSALAVPYGWVDIAEVRGEIVAAAVWMRSDAAVPEEVQADVAAAAAALAGDRASFAGRAETLLAPHRPAGMHLTLASIGVSPTMKGRGLGSATLACGLRTADTSVLPVYLETSALDNVGFYRRHGFEITATVDMPASGPRTWCMQRRHGGAS